VNGIDLMRPVEVSASDDRQLDRPRAVDNVVAVQFQQVEQDEDDA
jgi:hypothetical protein